MENNINTTLIEGEVVEITDLPTENSVCKLSVRNSTYFIDSNSGEWKANSTVFSVIAEQDIATACLKYLKKGDAVRVCGRLARRRGHVVIVANYVEHGTRRK